LLHQVLLLIFDAFLVVFDLVLVGKVLGFEAERHFPVVVVLAAGQLDLAQGLSALVGEAAVFVLAAEEDDDLEHVPRLGKRSLQPTCPFYLHPRHVLVLHIAFNRFN